MPRKNVARILKSAPHGSGRQAHKEGCLTLVKTGGHATPGPPPPDDSDAEDAAFLRAVDVLTEDQRLLLYVLAEHPEFLDAVGRMYDVAAKVHE